MTPAELLKLTPESLAQSQLETLRKHVIDRLNTVAAHIENGEYKDLEQYVFFSPAGDDHGMDNTCIDFDLGDGAVMDIGDAVARLETLTTIANGKGKSK